MYLRRQWHPTPVLLPGKSHGQRSLVGCGPWGRWGSNMTERLHFHFSFLCIGEGNGNPLQCSCLEDPRDGGAWWAVVYGVAQSRTWLKWLKRESVCISNLIFQLILQNIEHSLNLCVILAQGHANLVCIVPVLVYGLTKGAWAILVVIIVFLSYTCCNKV